jgi:hypothetical protein
VFLNNVKKQCIAILLSAITLSISAVTQAAEEALRDLDLNGSDCISIRTIRDYTTLSRDSLLIHAMGKKSYYVRLFTPQFGMNSSFQLTTRSRDDRLCPYGGDALVFGSFGHFGGEEARIRAISRLTPEQVEQVLIRYGKKEPEDTQDPAPPDLKGAEVEELG